MGRARGGGRTPQSLSAIRAPSIQGRCQQFASRRAPRGRRSRPPRRRRVRAYGPPSERWDQVQRKVARCVIQGTPATRKGPEASKNGTRGLRSSMSVIEAEVPGPQRSNAGVDGIRPHPHLLNPMKTRPLENNRTRRTAHRAGFTLLEVLITVAVLMVGLLAMSSTSVVVNSLRRSASDRARAHATVQAISQDLLSVARSASEDPRALGRGDPRGLRSRWLPRERAADHRPGPVGQLRSHRDGHHHHG